MPNSSDAQTLFTRENRVRLRQAPVCPFPEDTGRIRVEHLRALEALRNEAGGQGLPMPGGFLLDPIEIEARMPMPSPRFHWQVPLAYHPRFGLIVGGAGGNGQLHLIHHAPHPWSHAGPTLGRGGFWSRNWRELVDRLFVLDDAMSCAYVVWVRVGWSHDPNQPLPDHWNAISPVLGHQWRDRLRDFVDELRARPRLGKSKWTVSSRDDDAFVIALGQDLLIACQDADDLARVLVLANDSRLPVQPESCNPDAPRGKPDEVAEEAVLHRLDATGHEPRHELLVSRDGDDFLWTWRQDGNVNRQERVSPGFVPRTEHLPIPAASPRLRRHLGRHGTCRVRRFHSIDATYDWLREYEPARDWRVLAQIETEVGGLVFTPQWGLTSPNRIGPWLVWNDRPSFEELCDIDDDDHEVRPFPFLRYAGVELAVVGIDRARIPSAYCVDRDGVVYYLDHEFMSLSPLATSVPKLLEKDALRWELYGDGVGIGSAPALAVRIAVDAGFATELGMREAPEASDAVSQLYLTPNADAQLVVAPERTAQSPSTTLFTRGSATAVRVARALRQRDSDEPIRVRITAGDPASDACKAALEAAGIDGLDFRGWYGW
jgi:hypothetical protein